MQGKDCCELPQVTESTISPTSRLDAPRHRHLALDCITIQEWNPCIVLTNLTKGLKWIKERIFFTWTKSESYFALSGFVNIARVNKFSASPRAPSRLCCFCHLGPVKYARNSPRLCFLHIITGEARLETNKSHWRPALNQPQPQCQPQHRR